MRLNSFTACSSDVKAAPRLPCTLEKHDLCAHIMFWQETQRVTLEPVFLGKEYFCTSGQRAAESNTPRPSLCMSKTDNFFPQLLCAQSLLWADLCSR